MSGRLSAQDWIDFALATLAREGFEALKAEVLARRLGISRGSFYWHFADLGSFHARVIDRWKQIATEAVIADIERCERRAERLDALLRHAFGRGAAVEIRMRRWADANPGAARAVNEIDRRRRAYIKRLLVEAGIPPAAAAARAQLLYWAYLGAAMSGSRLTGKDLDRAVSDLKRLALAECAGDHAQPERKPV